MRFIDYKTPGPPNVLFINEGKEPAVQKGDVLIEVKAAGVNRPDILQRKGLHPPPKGASPILGLDVAGIVKKLGADARRFKIGDKVCALTNGGGYAELCSVPETQCLPIPAPLDFVEAASLPEVYFTVWGNVFLRGRLRKDETILIHAGASGIGSCAIQLAKAFGIKVITTTSNDTKINFCKSLKADLAINYKEEDFESRTLAFTENKGVDLVLDIIAGSYFTKNLSVLAEEGRLIQIAYLQGGAVSLELKTLIEKRLLITGSGLRPQSREAKGKITDGLKENVWQLFEKKLLKPTVAATFPWEKAAKAHELLESNQVCGKIVLIVQ